MPEKLTVEQVVRQDLVDNLIWKLVRELAGLSNHQPLLWDIECIARIRDAAWEYIEKQGLMTEQGFYPFVVE